MHHCKLCVLRGSICQNTFKKAKNQKKSADTPWLTIDQAQIQIQEGKFHFTFSAVSVIDVEMLEISLLFEFNVVERSKPDTQQMR